jgi:hypothetical protein
MKTIRMAEVQRDLKTVNAARQDLAKFVSSGVPKKAAAFKAPQIVTPPTIRFALQRPIAPQLPRINVPQAPKASVSQPPQTR